MDRGVTRLLCRYAHRVLMAVSMLLCQYAAGAAGPLQPSPAVPGSSRARALSRVFPCLRLHGGRGDEGVGEGPAGAGEALFTPVDPLIEGKERLTEALGLMANLDKEIEAAQAKVDDMLSAEEDDEATKSSEHHAVTEPSDLAQKRVFTAVASGGSGGAEDAMQRVTTLEAHKNELEVPALLFLGAH